MPRKRSKAKSKTPVPARRPVWSGTLAFGLVTLPVDLYSATRPARASLRMIAPDGTPLRRRYVAQDGDKLLDDRDIVRGYPVGDDEFVLVEDSELDALDPERSRVIDLESFVPAEDIDPGLIENSYVLVPDPDATTAYRLLVKSMTDSDRTGIATFVMRGKSYVVAILAHDGTLRAVTLRYHDEMRSPADIGLPELETADVDEVERYRKAMKRLVDKELDADELVDRGSERLRALADKKLKKGRDVHKVAKDEVEPEPQDGETVDIMELLRQSLGRRVEA
ncbi:MAG TPA: Ku protein [Trueperaceae bacterium]|nr:Ku protein [Trueperaceae bacterium]